MKFQDVGKRSMGNPKEAIKHIIDLYAELGLKITRSKAKEIFNEDKKDCERSRVLINEKYQVLVYAGSDADKYVHAEDFKGKITYLSIKRRDKKPIHDWRELQKIKNAIVGDEVEAIELYPAESRLVDTANQYHLFCLPLGTKFPFGWLHRAVDTRERKGGFNKVGQRAIE